MAYSPSESFQRPWTVREDEELEEETRLTQSAIGQHLEGLANGYPGGVLALALKAPRNRLHPPDYREKVTARSADEAARTLRDNPDCAELDFAYNVDLAGRRAYALFLGTATDIDVALKEEHAASHSSIPGVQTRLDAGARGELERELAALQEPGVEVFRALAENTTLEALRVDCKGLAGRAVDQLSASMQRHRALRILDLNSNCVSPIMAHSLGQGAAMCGLKELYLDYNFLGNTGVAALSKAMHDEVALDVLSLRGNRIGPAFPEELLWLLCVRPTESGPGMTTLGVLAKSTVSRLHLDRNLVREIPARLGSLTDFLLTVDMNPVKHPPPDVTARGWPAMFEVLREEFLKYEKKLEENAANYNNMLHNNTTLPVWMAPPLVPGTTADDLDD